MSTILSQTSDADATPERAGALCDQVITAIKALRDHCHRESVCAGWHDTAREDGTLIALIHSELSEALEGVRRNSMDEHLPHRPAVEVELADAVIRIMDYCGLRSLDIAGAISEKVAYNRERADHKRSARAAPGGKAF